MAEPLFGSHCGLPFISRVDFDFVEDCVVPPAPPAIIDCDDVQPQVEPPPPEALCPAVGGSATLQVIEVDDPPSVEVAIYDGGGPCSLFFDFTFYLPGPVCPTIKVSATTTPSPPQDPPQVTVTVTKSQFCDFMFDFEFAIPNPGCPVIAGSATTVTAPPVETPEVTLTVTQPDPSICEYLFDFTFYLPTVTTVCPTLTGSATLHVTPGEQPEPTVTLNVTRPDPSICDYLFEFDFIFPCEPTWSATASYYPVATSNDAYVYVTLNEPTPCEKNLHFDFGLVRGPRGSAGAPGTTGGRGSRGSQGEPGPRGSVGCPPTIHVTANTTELSCGMTATVDVSAAAGALCGEYTFYFDFAIPTGCRGSRGLTGSAGPAGTSGAPGEDGCDAVITADAMAETLACEEGATADVTVTPGACGEFHLDFEFGIPRGCDGDKLAIIPMPPELRFAGQDYVGMVCVEAPDVRFEDVMVVTLDDGGLTRRALDRRFVAACEPDSIQVVGCVPSDPFQVGAKVASGYLYLTARSPVPQGLQVVAKVSGIRRGREGVRFRGFTQAEYEKNQAFWNHWQR